MFGKRTLVADSTEAPARTPSTVTPGRITLVQQIAQTAPATGQNQRFHNSCRASHFTLASNQLDSAARAGIRDQIVRFARGFNVTGSALSGILIAGGAVQDSPMARVEDNVGWFADYFIEWVNAGLAAEGVH